jgi:hypothetical protein
MIHDETDTQRCILFGLMIERHDCRHYHDLICLSSRIILIYKSRSLVLFVLLSKISYTCHQDHPFCFNSSTNQSIPAHLFQLVLSSNFQLTILHAHFPAQFTVIPHLIPNSRFRPTVFTLVRKPNGVCAFGL